MFLRLTAFAFYRLRLFLFFALQYARNKYNSSPGCPAQRMCHLSAPYLLLRSIYFACVCCVCCVADDHTPAAAMKTTHRDGVRISALALSLQALVLVTMMTSCVARTPDGLVVVSRHGVRRQFPSSTHDFAKYAPGKVFAMEDEVRAWESFHCPFDNDVLVARVRPTSQITKQAANKEHLLARPDLLVRIDGQ